jgi:hypothetical protein
MTTDAQNKNKQQKEGSANPAQLPTSPPEKTTHPATTTHYKPNQT